MVNEVEVGQLKKSNGKEDESKTISLRDARPKAQDSQIKVIKPVLLKEVDATVKEVDIKLDTDEFDEDSRGNPFYGGYVTIVTNFVNPENGDKIESRDFFGGFRAYVVTDDTDAVVMDPETGLGEILRYLPGVPGKRQGALRRVIDAIQKDMTEEEEIKYNDWLSFFLDFLPGKDVRIKSEINTGDDGKNNVKQCIVGLRR